MLYILLQADAGSAGYLNLIFMAGIFGLMYFFLIRPQAKKQREQAKFSSEISKGDEVVTASGIIGRITNIEDEIVTLDLGNKNFVRFARSAISKDMTDALFSKKAK